MISGRQPENRKEKKRELLFLLDSKRDAAVLQGALSHPMPEW